MTVDKRHARVNKFLARRTTRLLAFLQSLRESKRHSWYWYPWGLPAGVVSLVSSTPYTRMPPFASVLRNRQFQIGTQTAWRIDWLMDDLGMRYIEGELSVGGPEHPGVAAFRYDFAGMEFAEYYNMLYHRAADGNEFLVFVGCGGSQTRAAGVGYSIGMVLSRELVTELPDSVAKEINDAMVLVGLDPLLDRMDVRDWCPTVYQSCPRDGWESWLEMLEHH